MTALRDPDTGQVTHDPARVNAIMRDHFAAVLAGGLGAEADEGYFRGLWSDTARRRGV